MLPQAVSRRLKKFPLGVQNKIGRVLALQQIDKCIASAFSRSASADDQHIGVAAVSARIQGKTHPLRENPVVFRNRVRVDLPNALRISPRGRSEFPASKRVRLREQGGKRRGTDRTDKADRRRPAKPDGKRMRQHFRKGADESGKTFPQSRSRKQSKPCSRKEKE